MAKRSFGEIIAELRKQKGMTQLDLATKMGVTDKAVSKWERNLSFPDVASLPALAEILDVSVDELLEVKTADAQPPAREKAAAFVELVLKAVALAMGVGVAVLAILDAVETTHALALLGVGLACLAVVELSRGSETDR